MASDPSVTPEKGHDGEPVTTREELDFNNEPASPQQETGRVSPSGHETTTSSKPPANSSSPRPQVSFQAEAEEIPPAKPARPNSPTAHSEHTLIEAFPSIDAKVVKAVLMASGGKLEPAFNALLGMSDPDFKPEDAELQPPPQPPRPQRQPRNQMEADEMYARQLAEQYNAQAQGGRGVTGYNQREPARRGPNAQRPPYDEDDRERSFLDDDLPEIGRNIQQGFRETQKNFNSWISNLKKRIDGEDEEDDDLYSGSSSAPQGRGAGGRPSRQNFGSSQSEQLHGIRKLEGQRRSVEQQRYDADPHVLGDDEFSRLELKDDEAREYRGGNAIGDEADIVLAPPQPPRRPPQSGAVDEVEHAERQSQDTNKARKWQPLTSVAPHPEDDNDPFSLGDDDEKEDKAEDTRKEDSARLKEAARQSVSEGTGGKAAEGLVESEKTGVKNADAEKLLNKD